jgi:phosphate starvation-inducible protein PhoH
MKRKKLVRVLASVVLAVITSSAVQAQDRARNSRVAKQMSGQSVTRTYATRTYTTRTYKPRITSHSDSKIVEGRIIESRDDLVIIRTARGARYEFRIDDQTTVFSSGELVSIATMGDITLSSSELRVADRVEIVAEGTVAKIITRVAASNAHIASR